MTASKSALPAVAAGGRLERSTEARQRDREQGLVVVASGTASLPCTGLALTSAAPTPIWWRDESGGTVRDISVDTIGSIDRRDGGAGRTGAAPECHACRDAGGDRPPRAWHDGGDHALLERKGARVALLTTEGHRDVVEMREGLKPDRYDLRSPPPEPLVPREWRFGVRERLRANGEVSIPLDPKSLDDAIAKIKKSGATWSRCVSCTPTSIRRTNSPRSNG